MVCALIRLRSSVFCEEQDRVLDARIVKDGMSDREVQSDLEFLRFF